MNPWLMEKMANYESNRIQRDIKQIHLEKEATMARRLEEKTNNTRLPGFRLLLLIISAFVRLKPFRVRAEKISQYDGSTSPCIDCDY